MEQENKPQENKRRFGRIRIPLSITRISWRDLAVSLGPVLLLAAAAIGAAFWFVRPAPPGYHHHHERPRRQPVPQFCQQYKKILERSDITLEILPSAARRRT